ncbi:hypothetical protein [Streptomyces ehimensis]|uniref:Cytochrome C biogenesis protein transmembrane domain-containing protein n=1 Tax=Streptomyces ehimensis TaxID=68195 RepID=A0ABV9BFW8_9ACTN
MARTHAAVATTAPDRRTTACAVAGVVAGVLLAVVWSARLVDGLGVDTADGLLGRDSLKDDIPGSGAGVVFAFVVGLAGTFTACNVAAFGALAPMAGTGDTGGTLGGRLAAALRPLAWVTAAAVTVAAVYGGICAAIGPDVPQLSTATGGGGIPPRALQALIVFTLIGLAMVWLGFSALGLAPDPLAGRTRNPERLRLLLIGALIGGFVIGRPYPLFRKTFAYAADTHNALYGALLFALIALGNMVVVAVLFLALALTAHGRVPHWLNATPTRAARVTGTALLLFGTFTVVYWGIRLPARYDWWWFPSMPWNGS